MTTIDENEKSSNKKLWWFLIGIVLLVIGIITVFMVINAKNNATTEGNPNPTASSSSKADSTVPNIKGVTVDVTAKDITFNVQIDDYDQKKWSLEYEIADQNRVVKKTGTAHGVSFEAIVPLNNSAYYRIKTRYTNANEKNNKWSEAYTVKLEDVKGVKVMEPNPDYFKTGWATGSDVTQTSLKDAIKIAWGAVELEPQDFSSCLPINSGDISPKLMLPPVPAISPSGVEIGYTINSWNEKTSTANITYAWCQL